MTGKTRIRQAVIVAAGFGSRLQAMRPGGELIKPLEPVGGVPILRRVLSTAFACGIEEVILVTGFMAEALEAAVSAWELAGPVRFVRNERYDLSNGISLLCGARECEGDFVLLMSDHLFDGENLRGLLAAGIGDDGAVLAIDRKVDECFDLDDATKVVTEGDRIVSIGKQLEEYNAIDTGMFLISSRVVELLAGAVAERGDASISDAMTRFIREGKMGGWDIGSGLWQDVDTPEMLSEAERLVAEGRFPV
jgi:1L-myo-inositol 1-phosphate cytidylyltransferase